MRWLVACLLALLVAGCAVRPVHIICKGKGMLTVQGFGSVQGDCGDGFEYRRTGGGVEPKI